MYRVMIVDDEHFIREGIKNCIRWEAYKISSVLAVSGGKEAIAAAVDYKPHLVLCDIMMDDIDGFDVMKTLKKMDSSCKVIFLTGHDDFKFAQRAVKLGAFDYLLKISSADEIIEVVKKAVAEIEEDAERKESYKQLQQEVETYSPLIRDKMMNLFVNGEALDDSNNDRNQIYYDLKNTLEISYFMIVAFRINSLRNPRYTGQIANIRSLVQSYIYDWSQKNFQEHSILFQNMAGDFVVVCAFPDAEDRNILENMFVQNCNIFKQRLISEGNTDISTGIGNSHKAYTNINVGYNEAIEALDYYNLKENGCVHYKDIVKNEKVHPIISKAAEKHLMSAFKSFDTERIILALEEIFKQFDGKHIVEKRTVIDFSLVLYGMLRKSVQELKVDISNLFQEQSYYNQLLQISEYQGIKTCVKKLFLDASFIISQKHLRDTSDNVQFACEYIEGHFNEDITLEKIAGMIHLSPSHFSNIFSKETGMSFLQYLTSCRIEQAKIMLMDKNYKTYEVGESVGYGNPHYFSRIFKKQTGIPPTQYREKMLKTNKIIKREK